MNGWTVEAQFNKLWDIIADIRDKYPRLPNDAPTDEIAEAIQDAGFLIPEPPSDEVLEAVTFAIDDALDDDLPLMDVARAALEAAEDARKEQA